MAAKKELKYIIHGWCAEIGTYWIIDVVPDKCLKAAMEYYSNVYPEDNDGREVSWETTMDWFNEIDHYEVESWEDLV